MKEILDFFVRICGILGGAALLAGVVAGFVEPSTYKADVVVVIGGLILIGIALLLDFIKRFLKSPLPVLSEENWQNAKNLEEF